MGAARVADNARQAIMSRGVQLVIEPTAEAIKTFNSLKNDSPAGRQGKKVAGLFHLTC